MGCESRPNSYGAVRGRNVAAVWLSVHRGDALELLETWAAHSAPDRTAPARLSAEALERLVPDGGVVEGWERAGDIQTVVRESLEASIRSEERLGERPPESLDAAGGFDRKRLLAFGFQKAAYAEYRNRSLLPRPLLRCAVMDMGTPENAFAYYASIRPLDADIELYGAEAFVDAKRTALWSDRFCVEVTIAAFATDTYDGMRLFAQRIGERMPGVRTQPEPLASAPRISRLQRSERWFRGSDQFRFAVPPLQGVSALEGAERGFLVWMRGRKEEERAPALWAEFRSEEEAREAFEALRSAAGGSPMRLRGADAAFRAE